MRRWNAGQWMSLGYVVALVLVLVADSVERRATPMGATMELLGLVRAVAGLLIIAFAVALHRALSPEPVSLLLLFTATLGILATIVGLVQHASRAGLFAGIDDGRFLLTAGQDAIMATAIVAAAIVPIRRHAAVPRYAWKATVAIAAIGAAGCLAGVWAEEATWLALTATGIWLVSASFFAWQAARVNVRPGGPPRSGWAVAR